MEVLILTIFVSLMLVVAAGLFFAWNVSQRSHEQGDRLVLLPLADETTTAPAPVDDPAAATINSADRHAPAAAPTRLRENNDDNN